MLVVCTNCKSKIRVPDAAAGKRVKCPKCATAIQVPLTEEAAPAPAPSVLDDADNPFSDMGASDPAPPARRRNDDEDDEAPAPPPRRRARADDEDDDRPLAPTGGDKKKLSIASLICGIIGVLCCGCVPLSIAAIVLGYLGQQKEPTGKTMALIGMILGGVGLLEQCGLIGFNIFTGGFNARF